MINNRQSEIHFTQTELANSLARLANYENNLLEKAYFFLKQLSHYGKEKNSLLVPSILENWSTTILMNPDIAWHKNADLKKLISEIEQLPKEKENLEKSSNYWLIGLISTSLLSLFLLGFPLSTSVMLPLVLMNLIFFTLPTLVLPLLSFALCENFFSMMIITSVLIFTLTISAFIGYNIESNLIDKKLSIFQQKIGGNSEFHDLVNDNLLTVKFQ